jgi:hypothetical protein
MEAVELVFTNFLRPNNVFIREDFPTFERPAKAISGLSEGGYWEGFTALVMKLADLMFIDRTHLKNNLSAQSTWC